MRKYNAHGTAIQHALDESISALVGDSDERRDSELEARRAVSTGVVDREARVFQVDKERVETAVLCELYHGRVGDESNAKGLSENEKSVSFWAKEMKKNRRCALELYVLNGNLSVHDLTLHNLLAAALTSRLFPAIVSTVVSGVPVSKLRCYLLSYMLYQLDPTTNLSHFIPTHAILDR